MRPERANTLIIDRWSSDCGSCGRGADLSETHHFTCLGYGDQPPGCGAEYLYLSSHYMGEEQERVCRELRPDLEWVGLT